MAGKCEVSSVNVTELFRKLIDVSDKWYVLGTQLGVKRSVLEGIREKGSVEEKMIQMLHKRHDSSTSCSQMDVVEALENMGLHQMAENLMPSRDPSSELDANEARGGKRLCKLRRQSDQKIESVKTYDDLKGKFAYLLLRLEQYLDTEDLGVVKHYLEFYTGADLSKCETSNDVVKKIGVQPFNTQTVEKLVWYFPDEEMSSDLELYNQVKKHFLANNNIDDFRYMDLASAPDSERVKVEFKVAEPENTPIEDVVRHAEDAFGPCYKYLSEMTRDPPTSEYVSWTLPNSFVVKAFLYLQSRLAGSNNRGVQEIRIGEIRVCSCFQMKPSTMDRESETDLANTKESEQQLQTSLATSKKKEKELHASLAASETSLTAKEGELAASKKKEEELQTSLTAKEGELAASKKKEEELQTSLTAKEEELAASKKKEEELQTSLTAKEDELAASKKKEEELQASLTAKAEELAASKKKEEELQTSLTAKEEKLQTSLAAKEELQTCLTASNRKLEKLQRLHILEEFQVRDLENHEQGPGNGCGEDEQQQEEPKRLQQKTDEDEVRLTASKEEQQRLLQVVEQWQRMGRARDIKISQLQDENELKYDASYHQLLNQRDQQLQLQAAADRLIVQQVSTSSLSDQHQKGFLLGETDPEDTEMHFMCLQFYKPVPVNGTLNVDLVFVVTYNLELFLENIRKQYCSYWEDRQNRILTFDGDTMVLDLPTSGYPVKIVDGWKILPLNCPQIAKADVQQFKLGENPPAIIIELEWTGSGEPRRLSHRVNIIGAKKPNDYFYIRYNPQTAIGGAQGQDKFVDEGIQQTLTNDDLLEVLEQLSDLTVSKYRRLGLKLGLKSFTISKLESDEEFGWHIMEAWLNQEDNVKNPTWKSLIAALQSPYVGQSVTAQRVRQWLTSR